MDRVQPQQAEVVGWGRENGGERWITPPTPRLELYRKSKQITSNITILYVHHEQH